MCSLRRTPAADLFHALDFGDDQAATFSHPCVDDLYEGSMVIKSPVEFEWSWRVSGPDKDGTISTVYRRADSTL